MYRKKNEWNLEPRIYQNANGRKSCIYDDTTTVEFDDREILLDSGGKWLIVTIIVMNSISFRFRLGFRIVLGNDTWEVKYQDKNYKLVTHKVRINRETSEVTLFT